MPWNKEGDDTPLSEDSFLLQELGEREKATYRKGTDRVDGQLIQVRVAHDGGSR